MFNQIKHPRFFTIPALLVVAAIVLTACGAPASAPVVLPAHTPSTTVSFSKDVLPIFQASCVSCHGGEKTSKGLDLKTYASLMTGSQSGAVIVSGNAANSMLIQSIQLGKMPKRGGPLPADQIQLIMDWVNAGAQNN
jgi:mono/diheme cytochrome c family protein